MLLGSFAMAFPAAMRFFDNPKFVDEFGKRNAVKVTGKSGQSIEVNLKGSQKAIEAVRACQDEQPKQEP